MRGMIHFMSALDELIGILSKDEDFRSNVTRWEKLAPREGSFRPFPQDLDNGIADILRSRGIGKLYTHQEDTYRLSREGKHTVVVTPTASGKTLCYNLPVMQTLLERPEARALYLFPTKALSQDQQSELNEIVLGGEIPVKVFTYDGDTPSSVRVAARNNGRIVITNPDMLHAGILPNHPKWISFLSNLQFVVIDEIHTYRGVFGSHMTNLIRRLKRIAKFYGSEPQFICCSATIGNPLELSERIIEEKANLVDNNGAPSGEKYVILYNPPLVDRVQGIRRGVVLESARIGTRFLKKGIKTIIFARSRVRTELIAAYLKRSLSSFFTDNNRIRIESYRGGYLPNERREIEKGLREGTIQGVVSTNALELGIDIGGLDVAILAGLPGSIASSWQQAGRAGRRNTLSIAVMISSAAPTDQYMIRHPEYFLGKSPESGWVDPDNLYILMDHLKCAVFELPFPDGEEFGGPAGELLASLEEEGIVRYSSGTWYWSDRGYPAEGVSLRSATSENVVIVDTTGGAYTVIGEMDRPSAKEMLFPNAIYIHRGNQYVVTNLDLENRKCYVETSEVNYYTDAITKTDIKVLYQDDHSENHGAELFLGDVLVRTQAAKFKKIKYQTHENVGYGDISLPEEEMHTRSVFIGFGEDTPAGKAFSKIPRDIREEVLGRVGTLLTNVAPFFLLCDRRDLGVSERLKDQYIEMPGIYIYDRYPGGTGLSEGLLSKMGEVLKGAFDLVEQCSCESGCPSCIGPDDRDRRTGNLKSTVRNFLSFWTSDV